MILDISDKTFRDIFKDRTFHLPIRWDNSDFYKTLKELYSRYIIQIENYSCSLSPNPNPSSSNPILYKSDIKYVCNYILKTVKTYLDGFPAQSYNYFSNVMKVLNQTPLLSYNKSVTEHFEKFDRYKDPLDLFRVTCVDDNVPYGRERVFHTPFSLRSRIATNRYSIAGYPCLYLGTSLELCCEEIHFNPHNQFALASKFKLDRNYENHRIEISVIELGIKPQDFLEETSEFNENITRQRSSKDQLNRISDKNYFRFAYLLWYPLIAACSYIRANKNHPFAAEYIVPQLLMQWVRRESVLGRYSKSLVGIRYFSCASVKSSEMGFNYVFPTVKNTLGKAYCPVLADTFVLTKPHFIHEYDSIVSCEYALHRDSDLKHISQ